MTEGLRAWISPVRPGASASPVSRSATRSSTPAGGSPAESSRQAAGSPTGFAASTGSSLAP